MENSRGFWEGAVGGEADVLLEEGAGRGGIEAGHGVAELAGGAEVLEVGLLEFVDVEWGGGEGGSEVGAETLRNGIGESGNRGIGEIFCRRFSVSPIRRFTIKCGGDDVSIQVDLPARLDMPCRGIFFREVMERGGRGGIEEHETGVDEDAVVGVSDAGSAHLVDSRFLHRGGYGGERGKGRGDRVFCFPLPPIPYPLDLEDTMVLAHGGICAD